MLQRDGAGDVGRTLLRNQHDRGTTLQILTGSLRWEARDLPERQQSLQAAIGWSYDLLPTEEQRVFRHLGVFVGRVSAAGMAAALGEDEEETLTGLVALTEKSLLLPVPLTEEAAEPAFGMLETVREYAREQLLAQGELETAAGAHAHTSSPWRKKRNHGSGDPNRSAGWRVWRPRTTTCGRRSVGRGSRGTASWGCGWRAPWDDSGRCVAT